MFESACFSFLLTNAESDKLEDSVLGNGLFGGTGGDKNLGSADCGGRGGGVGGASGATGKDSIGLNGGTRGESVPTVERETGSDELACCGHR